MEDSREKNHQFVYVIYTIAILRKQAKFAALSYQTVLYSCRWLRADVTTAPDFTAAVQFTLKVTDWFVMGLKYPSDSSVDLCCETRLAALLWRYELLRCRLTLLSVYWAYFLSCTKTNCSFQSVYKTSQVACFSFYDKTIWSKMKRKNGFYSILATVKQKKARALVVVLHFSLSCHIWSICLIDVSDLHRCVLLLEVALTFFSFCCC